MSVNMGFNNAASLLHTVYKFKTDSHKMGTDCQNSQGFFPMWFLLLTLTLYVLSWNLDQSLFGPCCLREMVSLAAPPCPVWDTVEVVRDYTSQCMPADDSVESQQVKVENDCNDCIFLSS